MSNSSQNSNQVVDYLLTKVPLVSKNQTVGEVIKMIRKKTNWETINYIYVLDKTKRLIGVVAIKELLRCSDKTSIKSIMKKDPAGVTASSPQEEAAVTAIQYNIKAVPIFKAGSREFLGTVGTDKILEILHKKHVEDFLKFSGINKSHPNVDILNANPLHLFRARLPWLLIGLVGGIIGVFILAQFEGILKKEIALSFFIPVVVYISNAIAIQSQALLIRRLASKTVNASKFLVRELHVSLWLGAVSALVISIFTGFWLKSFLMALTVGLAIFVSTIVAVIISITIPLVLFASKKDPALGSGPFAISIQDISTILIYFLIASLIIF